MYNSGIKEGNRVEYSVVEAKNFTCIEAIFETKVGG